MIPLYFLAGWNEVYYTIFTFIPYLYHIYVCIYISIYKYIECTRIQIPEVVREMFLHSFLKVSIGGSSPSEF